MKSVKLLLWIAVLLGTQACSPSTPFPTAAPTQTLVPYKYAPPTQTLEPITPTATSIPLLGPRPSDATGSDMLLMQYTKTNADGGTLVYSQELGMWMELHSPPEGIFLIDHSIAFYSTPGGLDLLPLIVETDPALNWNQNLIHTDLSSFYPTDRLRLVSFSSMLEIELALHFGIDLNQKNSYQAVTALLENINQGNQIIQFQAPGDSQTYTWTLNKGVRVWLVKDRFLDPAADASIYTLTNGDKVKIFAKDGTLEYIVSTTNVNSRLQQDGILAKILAPMFTVILSTNGKLPPKINSYYDLQYKKKIAGNLSDMAGPATVGGESVPGFMVLVGR